MTFAEKLQLLRKRKGFSQETLAEMLSVSRQSVSKWEAQQAFPETGKIIMISEIFDVSIDQLLKDELSIADDSVSYLLADDEPEIIEQPAAMRLNKMFCTKCGKENRSDSHFCGYCGTPFTAFVDRNADTGELTKDDMDLAYYKANLQMQQQALQIQQRELEEAQRQSEQHQQQIKLQKKQYDSMLKCPRCGSTSLSGNKKGYGVGKGLIGATVVGPFGLVAGNLGSKKVIVTCMNCGHRFKAGRKF